MRILVKPHFGYNIIFNFSRYLIGKLLLEVVGVMVNCFKAYMKQSAVLETDVSL